MKRISGKLGRLSKFGLSIATVAIPWCWAEQKTKEMLDGYNWTSQQQDHGWGSTGQNGRKARRGTWYKLLKNLTLFYEQQIMSETLTECKRHSTSSLSPKFRNNLVEFSFWMTLGSLSQIHIQNITNHKHYIFVSVLLSCTLQCTVVIRLFCLLSDTWVTFFEIRYVLFVLSDWWNIYICEEGTRVLLKRIPQRMWWLQDGQNFLTVFFVRQTQVFVWDFERAEKARGRAGVRGTSLCGRAYAQSNRNMEQNCDGNEFQTPTTRLK